MLPALSNRVWITSVSSKRACVERQVVIFVVEVCWTLDAVVQGFRETTMGVGLKRCGTRVSVRLACVSLRAAAQGAHHTSLHRGGSFKWT